MRPDWRWGTGGVHNDGSNGYQIKTLTFTVLLPLYSTFCRTMLDVDAHLCTAVHKDMGMAMIMAMMMMMMLMRLLMLMLMLMQMLMLRLRLMLMLMVIGMVTVMVMVTK